MSTPPSPATAWHEDPTRTAGSLVLHPGPDGWYLAPEGAAVHVAQRTAVIADVHLGYEWSRGARGDMIPAHSLAETTARLSRLLDRVAIDRLIVAGDLVESPSACPRTARDVRALHAWLAARGVDLVRLRGNHDPPQRPPLPATLDVAGWTVAHGDRPVTAPRLLLGHHHPVLRTGAITAPCFLVGPALIALPAFTPNAAGLDVSGPAALLPAPFRDPSLRLLATSGASLLDFGPRATLLDRLAR